MSVVQHPQQCTDSEVSPAQTLAKGSKKKTLGGKRTFRAITNSHCFSVQLFQMEPKGRPPVQINTYFRAPLKLQRSRTLSFPKSVFDQRILSDLHYDHRKSIPITKDHHDHRRSISITRDLAFGTSSKKGHKRNWHCVTDHIPISTRISQIILTTVIFISVIIVYQLKMKDIELDKRLRAFYFKLHGNHTK